MSDVQLVAAIIAITLVVAVYAVLIGVSWFALKVIPTKPASAEQLLLEADAKPLAIGTEAAAEKTPAKKEA